MHLETCPDLVSDGTIGLTILLVPANGEIVLHKLAHGKEWNGVRYEQSSDSSVKERDMDPHTVLDDPGPISCEQPNVVLQLID